MSEQADDAQKTEEPTQKKLGEARSRGQVAVSREINTWVMLLSGTLVVAMMAPWIMGRLRVALLPYIEYPHLISLNIGSVGQRMEETLMATLMALGPALLFFFIAALLGPILQNGLVFSPKALEPKLEKFDPIKGAKRIFSLRQASEFPKGIVKLVIVGAVALTATIPAFIGLDTVPTMALIDFLHLLHTLIVKVLVAVLAVLVVIAIIDLVFQRQQFQKQMRMTRQELKDEFRQSEGDPMVRQRLRQIRQERARARMMQAVPEADVVVTNPTHFAVALKYQPDSMGAPRVVAKGADLIAQRIREVAEEHGIAIVENAPLARALFASVELDDEVPPEHYQAVAEVISYVWNIEGRKMPGGNRRAR
jgi:flagellar biosynthesis protein FlhB